MGEDKKIGFEIVEKEAVTRKLKGKWTVEWGEPIFEWGEGCETSAEEMKDMMEYQIITKDVLGQ